MEDDVGIEKFALPETCPEEVARRVYTVHGMDWSTGYKVYDIEYRIEHVHVHFKPGDGTKMATLFCRLHELCQIRQSVLPGPTT